MIGGVSKTSDKDIARKDPVAQEVLVQVDGYADLIHMSVLGKTDVSQAHYCGAFFAVVVTGEGAPEGAVCDEGKDPPCRQHG